jgi:hypothetical protein
VLPEQFGQDASQRVLDHGTVELDQLMGNLELSHLLRFVLALRSRLVSVTTHDPQSVLAAIEASDRFLVQQVFRPIANEYRISIQAPGSIEEGEPLLYVKQKKLKIKEDIRFRLSPTTAGTSS